MDSSSCLSCGRGVLDSRASPCLCPERLRCLLATGRYHNSRAQTCLASLTPIISFAGVASRCLNDLSEPAVGRSDHAIAPSPGVSPLRIRKCVSGRQGPKTQRPSNPRVNLSLRAEPGLCRLDTCRPGICRLGIFRLASCPPARVDKPAADEAGRQQPPFPQTPR